MQTSAEHVGSATPVGALSSLLFLTSLCTLLLEILLTRVLSVVMWYHFTFAVISISLLGIAAGAMHCYRRFPESVTAVGPTLEFWRAASLGLNLMALAVLLPVGLMSAYIATPTFSLQGVLLLAAYFAACGAPFYASGFVTAAVFRFGSRRVSALYAYDLIGAALGCLIAIPCLDILGGVGSFFLVGSLLAAASALAARRVGASRRATIALATSVVFAGSLLAQLGGSGVDVRTVKLSQREESRRVIETKWNSYSRLAVLDYYDPQEESIYPFLSWGLSNRYGGELPRQYLITIDGASETPITEMRGEIADHGYLAWDITSLPYHLRPGAKALVIGSGGGRDLMTALWFGSRDVTGVELNRGIVDWMRGDYAEFSGHLYDRPEVRIFVDDGRSFVRAASDSYDVIQISMIDTFAATAAGAYTLSENNLYTAEAFDAYLDHLTEGGLLSINRFFLWPPQQTLRIVTLAREALERRGVGDAARHLVVLGNASRLGNNGLVILKKTPFGEAELVAIREICASRGFEMIAVPEMSLNNTFNEYLQEPDPAKYYRAYPFDVRPPADDWPFFFNTSKASAIVSALSLREAMEAWRVYNFDAVFILAVLLGLAVISLLVFVLLPMSRPAPDPSRERPRLPARMLLYFVCVGLGFILMEVVLIQRFHLYLGHPVYSLAVILVSVLVFSGLGSAWTARLGDSHLARYLIAASGAVISLIAAHVLVWPFFLDWSLGFSLPFRLILAVLSLAPIGLAMGMPYPLGLRAVAATHAEGLPWVWAVNAAASVLGSIGAFSLAMALGFPAVLAFSAVCYTGALASSRLLRVASAG